MRKLNKSALSLLTVAITGLGVMSEVQAATLTCGTPLRVNTNTSSQWSTDARYVAAPNGIATIVDNYRWQGTSWFDNTAVTHGAGAGSLAGTSMQGKWLSFGATAENSAHPAVNTRGVVANGAWVADRATMIYNEPITIGSDVDLASIKIKGTGGADNNAMLAVRPATLPGGVANTSPTPWTKSTLILPSSWTVPAAIDLDGSAQGLGFYYGDNHIGLAVFSEPTTASLPGGVVADFEITADCLTPPPPPPTAALICPAGAAGAAGQTVRLGPFTTNARDWKWTWRTSTGSPQTLENVERPLYDDFIWRSYFRPSALPAGQETVARWISPGTVDPAGADVPGVPYPFASGQAKGGFYGSVFTLNQPVTVGNNVDLATIRFDGRFGFDDTGDSVFVRPAGQPAPTTFPHLLPDGYGGFTSYTTAPVPGFMRGQNEIGLVLNGGQFANDCPGGACALAAIADFYITATCTGEAPIDPFTPTTPVPTLDIAGLGLLGLLSAGAGAFALRRRKRSH